MGWYGGVTDIKELLENMKSVGEGQIDYIRLENVQCMLVAYTV